MRESILVKVGEDYGYKSGKTKVDFINFLLYRMYNCWKVFNIPSGPATRLTGGERCWDG